MSDIDSEPKFKVIGNEFDGAAHYLAESFPLRMVEIVIQEAVKKYGAEETLVPTDVRFLPVFLQDESFFAVRAWHEAHLPDGQNLVMQPFDGNFDLMVDDVDGYLHRRPEDDAETGTNYKLSTAEFLGLISLTRLAEQHDYLMSFSYRETA